MIDRNTPPTAIGPAGVAWVTPFEEGDHALLSAYELEIHGAHPAWYRYALFVSHLRPEPNLPEPTLSHPDASHEIVIVAIDPRSHLDIPDGRPTIEDARAAPYLTPINAAVQLRGLADGQALEIGRKAIEEIVAGRAPVESMLSGDCQRWWRDALATTNRHYLEGWH